MHTDLLGYCGLYCGGCRVYQATQAGTPAHYEDGSPMVCTGCRSAGPVAIWCDTQCAIKTCCRDKGVENCLACADNPCEKMSGFMQDPAYPYHLEVQDNMKRLRDIGPEQWAQEMEARYHCKACAHAFNWFEHACSACGEPTR